MKNISLILNVVLLAAVAHLYYLTLKKNGPSTPAAITAPASAQYGSRIAFVESDTLEEKYEWLKQQSEAIEQRVKSAESTLASKQQSLMKDASALEERAKGGNLTQADYEKAMAGLQQRSEKIREEEARLSKSLADEQKKSYEELYAKVESKLKLLSDQIGYDYILSYKRGGPILLANDSLDITKQVLELLNAESKQ